MIAKTKPIIWGFIFLAILVGFFLSEQRKYLMDTDYGSSAHMEFCVGGVITFYHVLAK